MSWSDTADHALAHEVADYAESRLEDPFTLDGLTELEADVLATVTAIGVIQNGGFVYWYEGKDGEATIRAAVAFDRMGLPGLAEAMRLSLGAFPGSAPPRDLAARDGYVSEHREALNDRFAPLDSTFLESDVVPCWDLAAARYVAARRRELLALEAGFGPLLQRYDAAARARVVRLRGAVAALPPTARTACEAAIDSGELTTALDVAIAAGVQQGAVFWRELGEVGRCLGHTGRADRCEWWGRVAAEGALRVAIAFTSGTDCVYRTGHTAAWNEGSEPAGMFRARRASLFMDGKGWVQAGDQGEAFLVPGIAGIGPGATVVLHSKGEAIGRGHVIEVRPPRGS